MNDHELLLAIQELLDGTAWNSGMLEQIAEWMSQAGYPVLDLNPPYPVLDLKPPDEPG